MTNLSEAKVLATDSLKTQTFVFELDSEQQRMKEEILYISKEEAKRNFKTGQEIEETGGMDVDITGFIECIRTLIDQEQKDSERPIRFVDEYVDNEILQDPQDPTRELSGIISYEILLRKPTEDKTATDYRPRVVSVSKEDPNHPGEIVVYYMQRLDNYVSFNVVAPTATMANKIAMWFEELFVLGAHYLSVNGFYHFRYEGRGQQNYEGSSRSEHGMHIIPMRYYVKTRKTYRLTEKTLDRLVVLLSTKTN